MSGHNMMAFGWKDGRAFCYFSSKPEKAPSQSHTGVAPRIGVAPRTRVAASWSCRKQLPPCDQEGSAKFLRLPVDWLI